jgi:predicted TIM-barrel enzyme
LKNDMKIYEEEGESAIMARNVDDAPWKTLEPIEPNASVTL